MHVNTIHFVKYFVVILDNKLTFDLHIKSIISKDTKMLGFIFRACKYLNYLNALKSLYFAHVYSHLNYVSSIRNLPYMTYIERFESIQRWIIRFVICKQNIFISPDPAHGHDVPSAP